MLDFLRPVLYVRIAPQRLSITNAKTGETIAEVPELAIAADPKRIAGAGDGARAAAAAQGGRVVNPFSHPRSMVSDFTVAEQLLKVFLRRMAGKSLLAPGPRVVMHPLGDPEGGFTQVEFRAFREMALGAGATEVVLWTGRELTNDEVLQGRYPASAGVAE